MLTGGDKSASFGAHEDLFVANVRQDIEGATIKDFLARKGLEIVEIEKVSHQEARNASFKVQIKAEDKDKALNGDFWPYGVRFRIYRHYRKKEGQENRQRQFQD